MHSPVSDNDWSIDAALAPPPPGVRAEAATVATPRQGAIAPAAPPGSKKGHTFDAELEVGEMDDRGRPGAAWNARGREVSRERLVFLSRRMVREGSLVIIAVHMIDDEPMPLFGKVIECDYESDGLHRIIAEFRPVPWCTELRGWLADRARH